MTTQSLRIGALGAARITPNALIKPARVVPEVEVAAIAARDPVRARAFATRHGIPRVHASYEALIDDPELDAIYNPLPNSLHYEWTIRALCAGKHVLCEKPIANNAAEAERMASAAQENGRLLIEAFHYRYHPLAARMKTVVESGELGAIRRLEAHFCIPMLRRKDIRLRYDLGGGATMDLGCYTISLLRYLAGAEPEVTQASARAAPAQVDRAMTANFRFPDGRTARMTCAFAWFAFPNVSIRVVGATGELRVINPILPHLWHRLTVHTDQGKRSERVAGESTYTYQLRAFVGAVQGETSMPTNAQDAVANMRVIDAVYKKAGLQRRGT